MKAEINQKFYQAMIEQAKEDKLWAEEKLKELGTIDWNASQVSREMFWERLHKSIEELAMDKYKYFKMRAFAKGNSYNTYIDPKAKEMWEIITGEIIN